MKPMRKDLGFLETDQYEINIIKEQCPDLVAVMNDYAIWQLWGSFSSDEYDASFLSSPGMYIDKFKEWYGGKL